MRGRGDKLENTIKELRKTKKNLLSTLFQLERDQRATTQATPSTIRILKPSTNHHHPTTVEHGAELKTHGSTPSSGIHDQLFEKAEEDTENVESIASAVVQNAARLMEQNPNLAMSLLEQLNGILSRRRRNESDTHETRDDVYEQVMGSYAVERLIDQLIPQNAETTVLSPAPTPHAEELSNHQNDHHRQPHSTDLNREKSSKIPDRKKASRHPPSRSHSASSSLQSSSRLLTAGMRHPSIQVTSVPSPVTSQLGTPLSSVPSTPMSPNIPSIPLPTRVGNKRRQNTSPERPHTPGGSKKKKEH